MAEPFVNRMIEEYRELSKRLKKLVAFTKTDKFAMLDDQQRRLLKAQQGAMAEYKRILGKRIETNGGFPAEN